MRVNLSQYYSSYIQLYFYDFFFDDMKKRERKREHLFKSNLIVYYSISFQIRYSLELYL
jgi:hypothetical protein